MGFTPPTDPTPGPNPSTAGTPPVASSGFAPPTGPSGPSSPSGPRPAAPATFTAQDLNNKIRNIPAGSLFTVAPPEYSMEDWFLYFWKEAKGNLSQYATFEQSRDIRAFFNAFFDKGPDFAKPNPDLVQDRVLVPKGPFAGRVTDLQMKKYLDTMLRVGFAHIDLSSEDTTDAMHSFKLMQDKKLKASIYWRSEGRRDLEQLRRDGYTKQAADTGDVNGRRAAIKCDQPWHPFSDPTVSRLIWYRRASGDNCWYTAVSIASEWKTAVCYPKIDQSPDLQILVKSTTGPTPTDQAKYPNLIGEVEFETGEKQLRMVTKSKVAMVLVDTVVFDTNAKQRADKGQPYDERAVGRIEGKNVIAVVHFWRVHHGGNDSDGVTAIVDPRERHRVLPVVDLVKLFGDYEAACQMRAQLEAAYDDAFKSGPVSVRWDPSGWASVAPIGRIRSITLGGRRVV